MKIASLTPFYFLSGFVIHKIKLVDNFKFLEVTYARQMDIALFTLYNNSRYFIMEEFLIEFIQNEYIGCCNIVNDKYRINAGFSRVICKYCKVFSYKYEGKNISLSYLKGIFNF